MLALVGWMVTTTLDGVVWVELVVPHPGSEIARRQKITSGGMGRPAPARERAAFAVSVPLLCEFSIGLMCAKA